MSTVISHPKIQRLPKQLANQIAAGEVVERPSSIVKELVENSIDAGATRIEIEIEQGGARSILIRDDGCGIPGEQLALAVSRHATSKISSLQDLEHLYSMGFRGEALASIGSVSRMHLTSCQEGEEQAWQLVCDNLAENSEGELSRASHPPGTSIHVTNLFYNAPARRKFLRSERTEYQHIEEVVRRMALSHFHVQFQLTHNQRQVFNLPAAHDSAGQLRRLQRLCGKAFTEKALYLEFSHHGLKLHGWIVPASESRAQADLQYFYVNQRIIRDRVISHAIRQAYSDRIYPGRHPAYVLQLEMSPQQVDVNVHPTKHEVRFRESRLVHDFLFHCLSEALQGSESEPYLAPMVSPTHDPYYKSATGNVPYPLASYPAADERQARVAEQVVADDDTLAAYQPASCLYGRYLLVELDEQWRVVEIAKTLTHIYKARLEQASLPLSSLPLMFPLACDVSDAQAQWLEQHASRYLQWGMDVSRIGETAVMLRSLPAIFGELDARNLIDTLLQVQTENESEWLTNLASAAAAAKTSQWQEDNIQPLLADMHRYQLWDEAWQRAGLWRSLDQAQLQQWFEQDN